MPSLPSRNKTLAMTAIYYGKTDIKVFGPFYFCLISLLCPNGFSWIVYVNKCFLIICPVFSDFNTYSLLQQQSLSKRCNESMTVYSLAVEGIKKFSRNFANL